MCYLLNAPLILLVGLSLPCVDGNPSGGNSSSSMVLSGEDVARRPLDLVMKRFPTTLYFLGNKQISWDNHLQFSTTHIIHTYDLNAGS